MHLESTHRHLGITVATLLALALAGCSVKDVTFTPGGGSGDDAGVEDGGTDAPPSGPPSWVVDMTSSTITEGTSQPFTIALSAPPADFMLVTVASANDGKLGVVPTALVFSPTNWSMPKSVMLTGKADQDTANETVNVTLTADGIAAPYSVDITVEDDDGVNIALNATALNVGEGATATVGVSLTAQPAADVTLSVVSGNAQLATVSQATMTFTPMNWSSVQTLTVTGVQDTNTMDGSTMLTFSSAGIPTVNLPVTVTDDDVLALALSSTSLALTEGGTQTFTVALTQDPVTTRTVTLTTANAAIGAVTPTMLTFTGGAAGTWGAPQIVTVSAPGDDDTANANTTVTLSAGAGVSDRVVSVAVIDDDVQAILATPGAITVAEGGTASVAVRLAYRPAADVTIAVASLAPGIATVMPASLTFTPTNWSMPQNVSVAALQDADAAQGATAIRLEAAALGLSRDVGVTINDDDTLALALSSTTVSVTEGMSNGTFTVALTAQPLANTTVSIATSNAAAATATTSLQFTPANWSMPQTVTVTGVEDSNLASETVTLTLTGVDTRTVTVTTTDNDTQAIVASTMTVAPTEGSTASFTVRLAFQPAASVTVNVASMNTAVATVSASALTFTTGNWSSPQTITVTAPQDADTMANTTMVALTSTGLTTVNVTVNVTDDDALNIALAPASLSVNEGGTATLNVSLTAQPAADVTVTLSTGDDTAVRFGTAPGANTATVTLTTANWNTAQTVTVRGVEDADAAVETVTVTASAGGFTPRTATVTTVENDTLNLVTSAGTVTLSEGGMGTFTVRLGAQPAGPVSVAVTSNDTNVATVSPATLNFDQASWSTQQTVTIGGVEDINLALNTTTISLTSALAGNAAVTANVNDNDTQTILASASSVSVVEGQATTFTVRLGFQPTGNVAIGVLSANTNVATVNSASLNFNASNWNTPQTVTVTGASDANAADDSTMIGLTGGGAAQVNVTVNVSDDDTLAFQVETDPVTIGEGSSGSIRVRLTADPVGTINAMVASSNTSKVTVGTSTLTFSSANWSAYQSVQVNGVADADADNENVSVSLTSATITTRTVQVRVTDDEVQGILLDTDSIRSEEGRTFRIHVRLQAQPTSTVTVNVSSDAPGVAAPRVSTVTFTSADWSNWRPVDFDTVADGNFNQEGTTVRFTSPVAPQNAASVRIIEPGIVSTLGPQPENICQFEPMSMTVTLRGNPGDPLSVWIDAPVELGGFRQLLFDSANWSSPQAFSLTTDTPGLYNVTASTADGYFGSWTAGIFFREGTGGCSFF